ncbi:SLC13 family permease [bacterium BMS3Abin03]|nr:SLC13 family permease [bacterium BMS3Abin03]MCG6959014.1 SLC13 family permease [bacterium BMS3Abin03]
MDAAKKFGLIAGIIVSLIIYYFGNLDPSNPQVTTMAAIAALMALWWITEAIPLAATSLVPLILYPFFGILTAEKVAGSYINSIIFLFVGGFMIAIAMENWGLHKRIALRIIKLFGGSPNSIIIGFMVASAFLSMWISNTATAIMMLPIASAIISRLEDEFGKEKIGDFSIAVLLAIAYSCSIGGMATLVGTPPNLVFVKTLNIVFPDSPEVSFGSWMIFALPITIILLVVTALFITKVFYKIDKLIYLEKEFIRLEYRKLGPMTPEEKFISIVFASTAFLWIFRTNLNLGIFEIPGWSNLFFHSSFINDGTVAITMSSLLFFIPSKSSGKTLLDSEVFSKIPWGIVLLFGGGFALANGFTSTGLSQFIGNQVSGLVSFPHILMIFLIATSVILLTELTSNTATTQMILPIMASVSVAINLNPMLLMITATLSASMAFMLPVATPPNTIIFATGKVKIYQMFRTGVVIDFIAVFVLILLMYLLGNVIFGLDQMPAWAIIK